jgi:hypothetical protein
MSEPSTGQWADTIGQGLERIKAKMDLGVGPREFTFGNSRAPGMSSIHVGGSAVAHGSNLGGQFMLRGMLPDERGNLTDVSARSKRENGGMRDTLGMVSGSHGGQTLVEDWRSVVSGGDAVRSAGVTGHFGEPVHFNQNIPSEEMFQGVKSHQENVAPTESDMAENRGRMQARVDRGRSFGLGKEELPVLASGRRGAFHLGTGGFRYVED